MAKLLLGQRFLLSLQHDAHIYLEEGKRRLNGFSYCGKREQETLQGFAEFPRPLKIYHVIPPNHLLTWRLLFCSPSRPVTVDWGQTVLETFELLKQWAQIRLQIFQATRVSLQRAAALEGHGGLVLDAHDQPAHA